MDPNTAQIAEMVKKLLVVPDKLLTAQLSLRPLSHGDPLGSETEFTQQIADACDLMHSALADVVEVARNLTQLPGIDEGGVAGFHRIGADSYYREAP
jgi:hypothetical protein